MKAKEGDLVDKQPSDSVLMERIKSSDKDALLILTERWRAPAEQFAYSFVNDTALSEDIVQESFIKLWFSREHYRPDFTFKTYFFTIVKNQAINELKKRKLRTRTELATFNDEPADSAERECLAALTESRIYEQIERLRETDGDCFYMFAVCGMRTKDIARKLGISEVNVRVKIHRTREKLKKLLKKEGLL